jgi:hypothetical protein
MFTRAAGLVRTTQRAVFAMPKMAAPSSRGLSNFASTDGGFEKDRISKGPGESNTRDFTYFMLGGTRFIYASTARLALIKVSFISISALIIPLVNIIVICVVHNP